MSVVVSIGFSDLLNYCLTFYSNCYDSMQACRFVLQFSFHVVASNKQEWSWMEDA